ncbi:G-protein coupled receptor 87 isoform 2-T2 [Glossophaga mutica]
MGLNLTLAKLPGLTFRSDKMMNSTTPQLPQSCSRNALIIQQVIPVLYLMVFIVGILLNSMSAWIFFYVPSSKSFIIYLKSIVVADFLMSLTFPFKILSDSGLGPWQLGVFVCRVSAVLFYVNMYVSIVFFGLISFDRYYKIVKPLLTSFIQSVTYSKLLSVMVWLLMLLLAVPNIILTNQSVKDVTHIKCMELKNELGLKWHKASNYIFVGIFWIVFLLLIIFYTAITRKIFKSHLKSRRNSISVKKKSSRNIFSIMLVFFICFVPYHIVRIFYTKSQTEAHYSCQSREILYYVKEFTLLLSAANVCLDPVIYFFLCQPFREILCKKLHISLKARDDSETSRCRRAQAAPESTDTL